MRPRPWAHNPDALDALLQRQNYRLAFWRTASEEGQYRRFFDINELVGIRVEDDAVFADSHRLVLRWLREGVIDGLRVDHIDGLRDPRPTWIGSTRPVRGCGRW